MSVSERALARTRARDEPRHPDFVVRAKTGPGHKEWATIGYAWKRERGEGFGDHGKIARPHERLCRADVCD